MTWLCLVDIDRTLAKSDLGIHTGDRAEWERRLALPIRPIPAAARVFPQVAQFARVAIVSGRPEYAEKATRAWLRRHFGTVKLAGLHLCPVGVRPSIHKEAVYESYRARWGSRICAIDDVRWGGPRHFFLAPRQWNALLAFLQKTAEPAEAEQGAQAESGGG